MDLSEVRLLYKVDEDDNPFTDDYVQKELDFYNAKPYKKGDIKVDVVKLQGVVPDYLNVQYQTGKFNIPRFMINGKLWMSLTPMEIQSQWVPIHYCSFGSVALAGLGMGHAALRIAEHEDVDNIDIYEINSDVVEYFKERFIDRPNFEKFNFILGDARETLRGQWYDYLYVDIYQASFPDEVISDAELFIGENTIGEYRFWGEEKVIKNARSEFQMPVMVSEVERTFFKMWLESEAAQLRDSSCLEYNEDYVRKVLVATQRMSDDE